MVSLKVVKATNAQLKSAPSGLTFFFAGATNGIGLAALTALARHGNAPVAYIVGRSQTKFQPHLDSLKKLNPEGKFIFIEAQITELKEVKRVCDRVKSEVGRLDVLCLSPGYLTLVNHREDTSEGLEADLVLKYYARLLFVHELLPLLKEAPNPHVVSILAAGKESAFSKEDMDDEFHKNFARLRSSFAVITMHTLSLEQLAKENPTVSFSHSYPGGVNTGLAQRFLQTGSGVVGVLAKGANVLVASWLLPLVMPVGLEESGERALFIGTNSMYPPAQVKEGSTGGIVSLPEGSKVAKASVVDGGKGNGVYSVNWNNEVFKDKEVLRKYRAEGMDKYVWEHAKGVYARVLSSAPKA